MGQIKMSQSVFLFALCSFALCFIRFGSSCSSTRKPCPIPKTRLVPDYGGVIAGGTVVNPNRDDPIPYQLSIRKLNPSGNCQWSHICGAVILDEFTAVTAAHCFDSTTDVSQYRVYAGENRLDVPEEANEQVLEVKKLIMHPRYIDVYNGNDIAILHVDKFVFNKYAQPALLSSVSTATLSNLTAVISGWGNFSDSSGLSNSLRKGYLQIEPPQNCTSRLENKMKVPVRRGIVCALGGATRVCSGDSGGPLVIQNYNVGSSTGNLLVGITSFAATSCSGQNRAGAFTEISYFYDWIQVHRGDGGGWTIIQKRTSGPKHEFDRSWNEYVKGFGSLYGNFWLGLENIHALTKNRDQELRIEIDDFKGNKVFSKYLNFSISDASDFYRLNISGFFEDSTAGNSMTTCWKGSHNNLNGMRISTRDKDNDQDPGGNCADFFGVGGGWWFNECTCSNLNGLYFEKGETVPGSSGILWKSWKGWNYSLAKTEMKIRKRT